MKILLICQDNIGDLVFTTALIQAICDTHAHAHIELLTRSDTAEVAEYFPCIAKIYPQVSLARLNPITRFTTVKAYFRTLKWVRNQNFDVAINVSKNWRLGVLMKYAGVSTRIGFAYPKLKLWLTHPVTLPDLNAPVVPSLMTLLTPLGITSEIKHYALDMQKVTRFKEQYLANVYEQKQKSKKNWVGLHAFASLRNRCVDLGVWLQLSQELLKQGLMPIWFGAPQDMQELRAFKPENMNIGECCDQLCSGELRQSIPLLSLCDAYIGHDSGVLHLAAAMGIKTLGVFTPGEPLRTFAQGTNAGQTFHYMNPKEVDSEMLIAQAKQCFPEYLT